MKTSTIITPQWPKNPSAANRATAHCRLTLTGKKQSGKTGRKDPAVTKFSHEQTMNNCGFCHARRTDLTGDFQPGDLFSDQQSLAIVDLSDNFYPDGQVRGEDYEFAAFLGSKMHAAGVTCLDCHNPHSAKIILPGNSLCLRCHNGTYPNAPIINPVAHSHHQVIGFDASGKLVNTNLAAFKTDELKQSGGECVNCHMPQTVYMQRHWRHDHGFTIPDPLLTKEYGVPNACNRCHQDKTTDWALTNCTNWYGAKMERSTRQRAEWIARARNGDASARQPLLALLTARYSTNVSPTLAPTGGEGRGEGATSVVPTTTQLTKSTNIMNPYWQAVAAGLLGQWANEASVSNALVKSLVSTNPLVRESAVRALEPLAEPGSEVATNLHKLLDDPVRAVRLAATWVLRGELPADAIATRELQNYLDLNADQPTGQLQKGAYALAKNDLPAALAHYQKAVTWDPNSAPLRHDLAVVFSLSGRTHEAIDQLEAACRLEPKEAEYEFKLALAWNELGDLEKTARALEKAVQLNPLHGRAWFNLGLARNSLGQSEAALDALSHAETAAPADPEIPYARATILLRLSRVAEAKRAATHALELDPNYSDAKKLIEDTSHLVPPR